MSPARQLDVRRTIIGTGVVGLGLALAVVSSLAEEIGLEASSGVQAWQVAGLLASAGIVVAGALLMERSRLLTLLVASLVLLGTLDAWTFRDTMGADGVSYLDIGDQYLDGEVSSAINAYWSPLYAVLTGTALALFSPPPVTEFAVVHGLNLLVYLGAFLAFAFFLRELIRYRDAALGSGPGAGRAALPALWLQAVALVAFGWGVGRLIGVAIVTPDLLVAAIWFVAMALLLRVLQDPGRTRTLIVLGLVLGVGYLAKTAVLPIALSFVAVVASLGPLRDGLRRGLVVAGAAAVLALPHAVAISAESDSVTFGSSSTLTRAWYVEGTPFSYLPAETPVAGLDHPPRRLLDDPPTFVVDEPDGVTFGPWYDPTHWYAGTTPVFDLGEQVRVVRRAGRDYLDMLGTATGVALVIGFVLLLLASARRDDMRRIARHWRLVVPAVFGLAMYATVHVESRFVGAFIATIAVACYAVLPAPEGRWARRLAVATVAAVVAVGVASNVGNAVDAAARGQANIEAARQSARGDEQAADGLRRTGRGDCRRLALIAPSRELYRTYFPRLARMSIAVGITRPPKGWAVTPRLRAALSSARAELLVGRDVPASARGTWTRLALSDYYVYRAPADTRARGCLR
jgi:hypothetical protein